LPNILTIFIDTVIHFVREVRFLTTMPHFTPKKLPKAYVLRNTQSYRNNPYIPNLF
jgi:hypothetical protein